MGWCAKSAPRCGRTGAEDTFDFLVNNAGTAVYAPFSATQESDFDADGQCPFEGRVLSDSEAPPSASPTAAGS